MGKRPLSILNHLNPVSKYNLTENYYKLNTKTNSKLNVISKRKNTLCPMKKEIVSDLPRLLNLL